MLAELVYPSESLLTGCSTPWSISSYSRPSNATIHSANDTLTQKTCTSRRLCREMKHIRSLPIVCVPVKIALVVLRPKRHDQPLGLRPATHDRPRVLARLTLRPLPIDQLLALGQERADRAKRQADALPVLVLLRRVLDLERPLVRADAVQPLRVRLEAHDEDRVVRERHALHALLRPIRVWGRRGSGLIWDGVEVRLGVRERILLRAEGHEALRAEADVHDLRSAHDVDRLVGVLGDVVGTGAVVLYEDMIHGFVKEILDLLSDAPYCRGEWKTGRRLVCGVAVYWEAVFGGVSALLLVYSTYDLH